jgi:hypothetical protein
MGDEFRVVDNRSLAVGHADGKGLERRGMNQLLQVLGSHFPPPSDSSSSSHSNMIMRAVDALLRPRFLACFSKRT